MAAPLIGEFEKALSLRETLFGLRQLQNGCLAVRLLAHGEASVPIAADLYGRIVVFSIFDDEVAHFLDELQSFKPLLLERLGVQTAFVKHFSNRATNPAPTMLLWGEADCEGHQIVENDVRYWIYPNDGLSTGLFLDQRSNRAHLSAMCSQNTEILNLFSYTCAFSVACATTGAQTTSVDISANALERGRDNFLLNNLDLSSHKFLRRDSIDSLLAFHKKGRQFDIVIVDPPSFSQSRKHGTFSISKDHERLISLSLACCRPGGVLFFSTNYRPFVNDGIPTRTMGSKVQLMKLPATPPDFGPGKPTIAALLMRKSTT